MGTRSFRTVPLVNTIGKKTQIVVNVDAIIAPATCFVPCTAALGAAASLPRSLNMFSMTTIELSTSIPIPNDRPDRVIILSDRFEKYMRTIAKRTDSGILIPTSSVGLTSLRKRARIMTARIAPMIILERTSSTIRVI